MGPMNIILVLALASTAYSFTCPEDSHSFYHADVSTGCRVYHFCENSQLQTLECPSGKAFNHHTSQCEDASTVHCYETMDHHNMHHHHHKRAVEEYHTIVVADVKTKAVDFYHKIKPLVLDAVKDFAPSVYTKFEVEYLPEIQSAKEGVMPFVEEKIIPHVGKAYRYAKVMASRLFKKAYKAYELSNSTHITFPSMSDIANDLWNDLKPVINLGKYMSARLLSQNRSKRSADSFEVPDFVMDFMEPIIKDIISQVASTITVSGDSLTSKVVLPTFYELMQDPETRFDIMSAIIASKDAFSPLTWDMLSKQVYDTPQGTIIKIPREIYDEAMNKIRNNFKPVIFKLLKKHLGPALRRASKNTKLIVDAIKGLEGVDRAHSSELIQSIMDFVLKHGSVHQTSDSRGINSYTLTEIGKDAESVKKAGLKVFRDYMSSSPDSILGLLFGKNSPLYSFVLDSSDSTEKTVSKPVNEPVRAPAYGRTPVRSPQPVNEPVRAPVYGRTPARSPQPVPVSNKYLGLNSSLKKLQAMSYRRV